MKVISVKWPWCIFILYGGKDIENRSRRLIHPDHIPVGGMTIGIHCSNEPDLDWWGRLAPENFDKLQLDIGHAFAQSSTIITFPYQYLSEIHGNEHEKFLIQQGFYDFGNIIGTVKLSKITDLAATKDCSLWSPWAEEGAFHHILKNPTPFKNPIKAKGQLGLWNFEL